MKTPAATTPATTAPVVPDHAPTPTIRYSLPPLETLAALAATIAIPKEEPEVTARRACDLWQACAEAIELLEPHYKLRRDAIAAAAAFREETKDFLTNFEPGQAVLLPDFLRACQPNAKPEDRMARWRAFLTERLPVDFLMRGIPAKTPAEIQDAVDHEITKFRTVGIPFEKLIILWSNFADFLAISGRETRRKRAEKAALAKVGTGRKQQIQQTGKKSLGGSPRASKLPQAESTRPQAETGKPQAKKIPRQAR